MKPSEVREQILADHRRVKGLLDQVEEQAWAVLRSGGDAGRLRALALELERTISDMIEREQSLLDPALRGTDAFGEVRAEQLRRSHESQREALANARQEAQAGELDGPELARYLLQTVSEVRADLRREEQRSLSPDLLRDDVVAVSQSDG